MRKIILLMHISLDGFVAGPNGEMDWIGLDHELFDDVGKLTDAADTALYGRVTYQMMESYWPTAAESPSASKHDIKHANWANQSLKIVFSRTMQQTNWAHSKIIAGNIREEMQKLKQLPGKNLLMIGSPTIAQVFMQLGLIDEYRINLNPVALGQGIALFKNLPDRIQLELVSAKTYQNGVIGLHYKTKQ